MERLASKDANFTTKATSGGVAHPKQARADSLSSAADQVLHICMSSGSGRSFMFSAGSCLVSLISFPATLVMSDQCLGDFQCIQDLCCAQLLPVLKTT